LPGKPVGIAFSIVLATSNLRIQAQMMPPANNPTPVNDPPLITGLARLVKALKDRRNPVGTVQTLLKWTRRGLLALNLAYALILILILALLEWRAETHWFLSFAVYVPPQMWLLPVLVLGPITLLIQPRWCWLHLGCILWVLFGYMDPEFNRQKTPKGPGFKVITNNRGQDNKQSPTEFVASEKPDVVIYQDAGRESGYAKAYPDMNVRALNEFTVITRFPIKSIELLPQRGLNQRPVAMRCVLDWEGRELVIYSVHFISPREHLDPMSKGGFIAAAFGGKGGYGEKLRNQVAGFWAHQQKIASEVAELAKKETSPTLIAGDFNVPNHGQIYHLYRDQFTDAFEEAGSGYGLTFPGFTRNPLTFFGPWLRLDQVFSNQQLQPVACKAEPGRRSQHRCMVATFELKEK